MEVGIALPQFDFSVPGESRLSWETITTWAERAEALDFASVWLADHLFWSIERYGAPPGTFFGYDPLVALAGLARTTGTIKLGTLVLCSQLRPPAVLAKILATVDRLSGGRLVAGLGAGWYEPEYQTAEIPFERPGVRLRQLEEAVTIVRGLLAGGPFTYEGDHYRATAAPCRPPAVQQPVPVWLGGKGDRLLGLAGRVADGWNMGWYLTVDAYRQRAAVLDAACERAGRDPRAVTRSLALYTLVGEDELDLQRRFERWRQLGPPGVLDGRTAEDLRRDGALVGTVEQVAERLAELRDAGVGAVVCGLGPVPFSVIANDDVDPLQAACTLVSA